MFCPCGCYAVCFPSSLLQSPARLWGWEGTGAVAGPSLHICPFTGTWEDVGRRSWPGDTAYKNLWSRIGTKHCELQFLFRYVTFPYLAVCVLITQFRLQLSGLPAGSLRVSYLIIQGPRCFHWEQNCETPFSLAPVLDKQTWSADTLRIPLSWAL